MLAIKARWIRHSTGEWSYYVGKRCFGTLDAVTRKFEEFTVRTGPDAYYKEKNFTKLDLASAVILIENKVDEWFVRLSPDIKIVHDSSNPLELEMAKVGAVNNLW